MTVTRHLRLPLTPPQAVAASRAILWLPAGDPRRRGVVLGHGAGSDADHPALRAVATALADAGHPVLAFDFPYGAAGRRHPDPPARLRSAFADALALAGDHIPPAPPVLGGRSMGGRIASLLAADGTPAAGLALLSYPLHPPGGGAPRSEHWPRLRLPVLFVHGDRDALCDLGRLAEQRRRLRGPVTVHVVAGADHGYRVRRRDGRTEAEVLAEVADTVVTWVADLDGAPPTSTSGQRQTRPAGSSRNAP